MPDGAPHQRRRSPVWRPLWTVVISLAIGALATVAISWAFAYWSTPAYAPGAAIEESRWLGRMPRNWPATPEGAVDVIWPTGASFLRYREVPLATVGQHGVFQQLVYATGWPWRSLAMEHLTDAETERIERPNSPWVVIPPERWRGAILFGKDLAQRTRKSVPGLPLLPLWPGFGYSVLFYGAIAWLLFFAPRSLMRWRRRRRGACVRCGYAMAPGATRCAECGTECGDSLLRGQ